MKVAIRDTQLTSQQREGWFTHETFLKSRAHPLSPSISTLCKSRGCSRESNSSKTKTVIFRRRHSWVCCQEIRCQISIFTGNQMHHQFRNISFHLFDTLILAGIWLVGLLTILLRLKRRAALIGWKEWDYADFFFARTKALLILTPFFLGLKFKSLSD